MHSGMCMNGSTQGDCSFLLATPVCRYTAPPHRLPGDLVCMPVSLASDSYVPRNMEGVQARVCLALQTELGSLREGLAASASAYARPARPGLSKLLPGGGGWRVAPLYSQTVLGVTLASSKPCDLGE